MQALVIFMLAFPCAGLAAVSDQVDIHIGTGGVGFGVGATDISAQVPFGALRLGPDTTWFGGIDPSPMHDAGYYYPDNHITAFSHTRLVGAGVTDYGNIGVMPVTKLTESTVKKQGYKSSFSHDDEHVSPGYYSVHLKTPRVFAEVTAAGSHAGMHRYTFDKDDTDRYLLVDVCHIPAPEKNDPCRNATVQITQSASGANISGRLINHGGLSGRSQYDGGVAIYFAMIVDAETDDATETGVWQDGNLHPGTATGASDHGSLGAWVKFAKGKAAINVRIGISFVSLDQAKRNAVVQIGSAGFDSVKDTTAASWEGMLSKLRLDPSTPGHMQTMLYTAMYHVLSSPTLWTEVDGAYMGFDGHSHAYQGPAAHLYTDMSIWDTHRSEAPLLNLLLPDVGLDVIRSLETMARQGGDLPKWPLANVYTGCMTGQHSHVMIADAVCKNLTDFDLDFVYAVALNEATNSSVQRGGIANLQFYDANGYVPQDMTSHSASRTLEYAFDDWALSTVAHYLGDNKNAEYLVNRSTNYRNVWDPEHKFMCPRYTNGSTVCRLESAYFFLDKDYTEGNAWQWTWFVPQDPLGLVALFGSNESMAAKLNECFERSTHHPSNLLPNPYYWAGNEPDLLHPWLFPFARRPDLTQKWTRWLVSHKYGTKPDGIPGNDDYGTMSAWLLFASLGVYPLAGSPLYILGSPAIPAATLTLPGGTLEVIAHNWTDSTLYVSNITLNGKELPGPAVLHDQIGRGGLLEFTMSQDPSGWGTDIDWRKEFPEVAASWPTQAN